MMVIRVFGLTHPTQAEQASPRHIQVGQSAQYEQGVSIFGQATVAKLGKAEHALDHGNHMLDFSRVSG